MTIGRLRVIFAVLEQQRVSRDRVENLGTPDHRRAEAFLKAQQAERERKAMESSQNALPAQLQ